MAYFIARGFIIEFWKNRVLYFVGVYYWDSNISNGIGKNQSRRRPASSCSGIHGWYPEFIIKISDTPVCGMKMMKFKPNCLVLASFSGYASISVLICALNI